MNLHALNGHMDLNHARLPIPPLRPEQPLNHAKKAAALQEERRLNHTASQYLAMSVSISKAQASIPPASDWTWRKPCSRSQ